MTPIEELMAREAIRETKARYCRLLDTKRWEEWGELFTEDIEMDVSEDVKRIPGAATVLKGRAVVVAQVRAIIHPTRSVHQVHHPEIRFLSDTEAEAIWAMEDDVVFPDGIPAPFRSKQAFGHYYETYRREDGAWRIARLKLVRLIEHIVPLG